MPLRLAFEFSPYVLRRSLAKESAFFCSGDLILLTSDLEAPLVSRIVVKVYQRISLKDIHLNRKVLINGVHSMGRCNTI
jgi:hypothetical protein